MSRPILLTAAALAAAGLFPAEATAAKRKVPGQYETIQAAVDASVPGDVVLLSAGTYHETVDLLGVEDLTIRGKGKVVVESPPPAMPEGGEVPPTIFTVVGGGAIRLERLTIRDGLTGLDVKGAYGVEVDDCVFVDCVTGVRIEASAACRVRDSRTVRGTTGVRLVGTNGCHVEGTRVKDVVNDGISVSGLQNTVSNCRVDGGTQSGVRVGRIGEATEGTLVVGVRIRKAPGIAIRVTDGALFTTIVDASIVGAGQEGIQVQSGTAGHVLADNVVRKTGHHGLLLGGEELLVSGNRVEKAGDCGVRVLSDGDHGSYVANRIRKSAAEGLQVFGTGNSFHGNRVRKSGGPDLDDQTAPGANVFSDNVFGSGG